MAVAGFNQILQSMADAGVFTGVLPFLLTYVIFYFILDGMTEQLPVFDEMDNSNAFSAIVAIVFAFYTARFIVMNPVYQQFILNYTSRLALTLIGILGIMVVLGIAGVQLNKHKSLLGAVLAVLGLAAFSVSGGLNIFTTRGSGELVGTVWSLLFDTGLIWVIAVVGLLAWTVKDDSDDSKPFFAPWGYPNDGDPSE